MEGGREGRGGDAVMPRSSGDKSRVIASPGEGVFEHCNMYMYMYKYRLTEDKLFPESFV